MCFRYLSNGFSRAYNFVQPDVVIFLGDLFDEGSIANGDEEFMQYYHRFSSIFLELVSSQGTPVVVVPGDNDVGGEGHDMRAVHKTARFRKLFGGNLVVSLKSMVDVIQVWLFMD